MLQLFMTHAAGWNRSQKTTWFHLYNILEKDIKSDEGEISAAREEGEWRRSACKSTVWGRFWRERTVLYPDCVYTNADTLKLHRAVHQKGGGGGGGYFYCKVT